MLPRLFHRIKDWAVRDIVREIRSASNLQRALPLLQSLEGSTQRFEYAGVPIAFYVPDAVYDGIQRDILLERQFFAEPELRVLRDRLSLNDQTVVDAGANIGNHTVYFSAVCRAAKVHAFEPNTRARRILERNIALNKLTGVYSYAEGLADRPMTLSRAHEDSGNLGGTQFKEGNIDADEISARPLDDFSLTGIRLLKVDVEGMSTAVLVGAEQTLASSRPAVVIELWPQEKASGHAILQRHGYKMTLDLGAYTYLYER